MAPHLSPLGFRPRPFLTLLFSCLVCLSCPLLPLPLPLSSSFPFLSPILAAPSSRPSNPYSGDVDLDLGALLAGLGGAAPASPSGKKGGKSQARSSVGGPPFHDGDVCPTLPCSLKQRAVARVGYTAVSNGCGAYGMRMPDNELTPCCDVHDICYGTCGKKRKECDDEFVKCMKKVCQKEHGKNRQKRQECESTANLYAMGAQSFGCQTFAESQKEACQCEDHEHEAATLPTSSKQNKAKDDL